MNLLANIVLGIVLISWTMHLIGIPPVMYWRKERRVRALQALLCPVLDSMADDQGQIQGDPEAVSYELAIELDGRLNPW